MGGLNGHVTDDVTLPPKGQTRDPKTPIQLDPVSKIAGDSITGCAVAQALC